MMPLVVSYDPQREMWIVRDGSVKSAMTDGALMNQLDLYKERVVKHGGYPASRAEAKGAYAKLRYIWDRLGDIEVQRGGFVTDKRGLLGPKPEDIVRKEAIEK